ncbi:MAG: hypothetical protein ABIJ09_24985 [Pseudomonadota bacterium]
MRTSLLAVALVVATGCGVGSASFSGDIGDRSFAPVGTVFAFVDALEPAPELKGRDKRRVILAMTFAAFDPSVDQEQLSATELADLAHAIEIHDWLSLRWEDQREVQGGAQYDDVLLAGDQDGRYTDADTTADGRSEGFDARFGLAREALAPGASYTDYKPFATRSRVGVHLESVDLEQAMEIQGSLTIQVERAESDPADARVGTVEGSFVARVIGERVAEKNFETLQLYKLLEVQR